jgi:hypothetical protein
VRRADRLTKAPDIADVVFGANRATIGARTRIHEQKHRYVLSWHGRPTRTQHRRVVACLER